jgi:hypothetical protein
MTKSLKVVNEAGMPVEKLHIEVENQTFISDRNGVLELKAQSPNSLVKINYVGSPEIRTFVSDLGTKIVVDNGFKKETCKSKDVSMDYLTKEIRLINQEGNPLPGIEVFSESGLTNTITDQNGLAFVKVNDPEEYINFDEDQIEGQAVAFKSLNETMELKGERIITNNEKPSQANAWFLGFLGLGLIWNHARNQNKSKGVSTPKRKSLGMGKPVKITL